MENLLADRVGHESWKLSAKAKIGAKALCEQFGDIERVVGVPCKLVHQLQTAHLDLVHASEERDIPAVRNIHEQKNRQESVDNGNAGN